MIKAHETALAHAAACAAADRLASCRRAISRQAGSAARRIRARRRRGYPGAAARAEADRALGETGRGREPERRRRQYRHRHRGEERARRLHAAAGVLLARQQSGALSRSPLRHPEGLHRRHARRDGTRDGCRASVGSSGEPRRADRARALASGRGEVRLLGRRHAGPPRRRADDAAHRDPHDARAVQRDRAGDGGDARRGNGGDFSSRALGPAALQERPAQGARRRQPQSVSRLAGGADGGGGRTGRFEIDYWYALLGPAGLPAPIVERLQREISQIVTTPEMKESLLDQGSIAIGSPPEELNALIRSEYALWSRVVKAGNVKVE